MAYTVLQSLFLSVSLGLLVRQTESQAFTATSFIADGKNGKTEITFYRVTGDCSSMGATVAAATVSVEI